MLYIFLLFLNLIFFIRNIFSKKFSEQDKLLQYLFFDTFFLLKRESVKNENNLISVFVFIDDETSDDLITKLDNFFSHNKFNLVFISNSFLPNVSLVFNNKMSLEFLKNFIDYNKPDYLINLSYKIDYKLFYICSKYNVFIFSFLNFDCCKNYFLVNYFIKYVSDKYIEDTLNSNKFFSELEKNRVHLGKKQDVF